MRIPILTTILFLVTAGTVCSADDIKAEIALEKKYLNFPVKNNAAKRRMSLIIDGETVREFEIELAPGKPDFWVFLNISPFKGKKATLQVDALPRTSKGLESIIQSDIIEGAADLYKEKYRPQFHFSSRRGWNNDPNGLVYYKGEYHLFYQHNPYGWGWGNIHWGHALSRDLVHWEELSIALYPQRFGDWCFSGSAAVDWDNTAGFKTGKDDVIVAAYTSTGRGESIAYSNDRGRTFTNYEGNPVVKHMGRDPKIIWYEPGKHWVMAVYDEFRKKHHIAFYTSKDLKKWNFQSRIEGYFECPEIFELPLDGNKKNTRWIIYAADGAYSIGSFNGKTFEPESGKHQFNYGDCFYASQTFNDTPGHGNRRVQIAWGRIGNKDMPFNQMMNFPVELTLRTTLDDIRMFAEPVRQIEKIRRKRYLWRKELLVPGNDLLDGITGDLFEILAEFEVLEVAEFGFKIRGTTISYNVKKRELACRGNKAPLDLDDGKIRLHILVDRMSIEIFANDGRVYMPVGVIPPDENLSLGLFSKGGSAFVNSLEVYKLRSAWKTRSIRKPHSRKR